MIDVHAHIEDIDLANIDLILQKCKEEGLEKIIFNGYDLNSNKIVNELSLKYDMIYGAVGYMYDENITYTKNDFKILEEYISKNKKIVAIGEFGIDYYWYKNKKEEQKELVIKHFNLAKKYNLPVIFHSRDSISDTYDIFNEYNNIKKILHCYSGSLDMAKKFIKCNTYLSFNGIITFKNAKTTTEVIKNIDMEYILTETDSPYLTPEPYRGKRNYSYFLPHVVNKISEIKNLDNNQVIKMVKINTLNIFDF